MSKCSLTWYKSRAKRIMRDVSSLGRQKVANEIGVSKQAISYRVVKDIYLKQLEDWLRILRMAGYEIVEKEELE